MTAGSARSRPTCSSLRGKGAIGGPFGVFLHAPDYGDLAQKLGAHCRYRTAVPPRLSEFAILVSRAALARAIRMVCPRADRARSRRHPKTIKDLQAGRAPHPRRKTSARSTNSFPNCTRPGAYR
jgi:hypothetical protein